MRIICDLLSTIMPENIYQSDDFRRPNFPSLPPWLDPRVHFTKESRDEKDS